MCFEVQIEKKIERPLQAWVEPQEHEAFMEKQEPPDQGWTKMNFGSSLKGNPGHFDAGFMAGDWKCNILATEATCFRDKMNIEAEVQAALNVELMVKNLNTLCLHLEGDSWIQLMPVLKARQAYGV